MHTYLFYYRNMNTGGCQLLIANVAKEIEKQGDKSIIICEYVDDIMKQTTDGLNIMEFGRKRWVSDSQIKKCLHDNCSARIITFLWEDYSRVYTLKHASQELLFYAVHCDAVKFAAYSENRILRIIRKSFLRSTINRLLLHNCLVVMDRQTIEHSESYYGGDFSKARIVHIPVENSGMDEAIHEEKEKNILAIARAEFPFKGYLLGLINALEHNLIPDDFVMTIVSYGRDEEKIKSAIGSLSKEKKDRINWLGETPYRELKELYKKAAIYIGMGTTLLDASKYGTISVPVVPFTNDLLCDHFFHEKPEWVALETGTKEAIKALIERYSNMTNDEKKRTGKKCQEIVQNMYSVQSCAKGIKEAFSEEEAFYDFRIRVSYGSRKLKRIIQRCIWGGQGYDHAK